MYRFACIQTSWFVNTDIVFNFGSANGTLLKIFTAFDASSVMFAWHVHAVFLLLAANYTSVWMRFLAYQSHLNFAHIGLIGSYFENCLILDLEEFTCVPFDWEPLPCSIGRSHIFDVKFTIYVTYGGVDVAQMLVISEIQKVTGFSPHGNFGGLWYFHS